MASNNGVCPFKCGRLEEDGCYDDCHLFDDEKGVCVFAVMAMELEKIRRELKK